MKEYSKRALLDCLKYIGIIYIDNGNFLRNVVKLYNESVVLWQNAKIAETSNITESEIYNKYQDAYESCTKLHEC
jgi:hypothetical protein